MEKKKIARLPMNIFDFYAVVDNEACLLFRINGVKIININNNDNKVDCAFLMLLSSCSYNWRVFCFNESPLT